MENKGKYKCSLAYDHLQRWCSYWYQINEVMQFSPETVLEVGIGMKVVAQYLFNHGIKLTTLDVDGGFRPDIVASVLRMPLDDNSFDVVLAAETLEHLPWSDFLPALREIHRVSKKYVVISLPHWGRTISFSIKIPLLPRIKFALKLPVLKENHFDPIGPVPGHYWEIGKKGYSVGKIRDVIKSAGFHIKKDFLPVENPYHHFFVLEK